MDIPGHSMFGGGSLHMEGFRTHVLDDEEEENRRKEEEEEEKRREEELQGILADEFDNPEEEDSYVDRSHQHSGSHNQAEGGFLPASECVRRPAGAPQDQGEEHTHAGYQDMMGATAEPFQGSFGDDGGMHDSVISSSHSDAPWSPDNNDNIPNRHILNDITDMENKVGNLEYRDHEPDDHYLYDNERSSYTIDEGYQADTYQPQHVAGGEQDYTAEEDYKEADTSMTQLQLLYETRGRELDKQTTELNKLKLETDKANRRYQHNLNILKSEKDSKEARNKQLQKLLSESEERTRTMEGDIKELHEKVAATQGENNQLHLQLETAQSTISSLECHVKEMKAADHMTRNQQSNEDFVRKLQHGNQQEKDLLKTKLQESCKENSELQQEVKRLREEMKNIRNKHDEAVVQKTTAVTELNIRIETMRKQYEELLRSHDSHQILEMELKVKKLESGKESLENQVLLLQQKLAKSKEDLEGFDTALKLGMYSEMMQTDDSIAQLGIKKTLNYDDAQGVANANKNTRQDKTAGNHERVDVKEELKKSLMINKAKRNEICILEEESRESQAKLKKAHSDLKTTQVELKELHQKLLKLETEAAERECLEKAVSDNGESAVKAENIALKQELSHVLSSVREKMLSNQDMGELLEGLKIHLNSHRNSEEDIGEIHMKLDMLLRHTDVCHTLASDSDIVSELRRENSKLHEGKVLWEKMFLDIKVQLKLSEKLIVGATLDSGRSSELHLACTTLKNLFEALSHLINSIKNEHSGAYADTFKLKSELSSCQLQVERMKEEIFRLEGENVKLAKKKDEEKDAAIEHHKQSFFNHHEQAIHELKARMKSDYENIADSLKQNVARLSDELCKTKELYVQVCQEKREIEDQVQKQANVSLSKRFESGEVESKKLAGTPDSGVSEDSLAHREQQRVSMYEQKIEELEMHVSKLKESHIEDHRKLLLEKESIDIHYKNHVEETTRASQEANNALEEFKKKCRDTEEVNKDLEDRNKIMEEEISRLRYNNEGGKNKEGQEILEKQQRRLNQEKEEMKTRYENLIQELQNKYTQADTSELLEDKVQEQENCLKQLEDTVREQKDHIQTIVGELARMKDKVKAKDEAHEEELRRLTDIVQNLEGTIHDREEKINKMKLDVRKLVQENLDEEQSLKKKLQVTEEEVAQLRETKIKYNTLKVNFTRYKNLKREQKDHYEGELNRLTQEYRENKESWIEDMRVYVAEVRKRVLECLEDVIAMLRGVAVTHPTMDAALCALEQVAQEFRNMKLTVH